MITDEQVLKVCKVFYEQNTTRGQNLGSAMRKALEAYEQSKPKPEPVAGCRIENNKVIAVDWDGVTDNCPTPLYTTQSTREPLSEHEINNIVFSLSKGSTLFDFARLIEQAHGIGTPHEPT